MRLHPSYLIVPAFALAVAQSGQAFAGFSLEGDAKLLTVVADQALRSEVIAEIARRLSVQRKGAAVAEGPVSGKFTGDLSHVLNSILPHNGFVIAYSDGRPVAVTFTGRKNQSLPPLSHTVDEPIGNRPNLGAVAQTGLSLAQPGGATGDNAAPAPGRVSNRNNSPPITVGSIPRSVGAHFIDVNDPLHLVPTDGY